MVRLLIQFTEAQAKTLRAESRRRKKPVAALVRESVDLHLAAPAGKKPRSTNGSEPNLRWVSPTPACPTSH
jgi:hypothetical protein